MNIVDAKATSAPRLVVTSGLSFWRTPEVHDAISVNDQLQKTKDQVQDNVAIGGSFFQETRKAKLGNILRSAATVAVPALATTGLWVAGLNSFPGSLLTGAMAVVTAVAAVSTGAKMKGLVKDYQLALRHQKEFEGLDVWRNGGPPRDLDVTRASPSQKGLQEMLMANMKDFPGALHILHANGHGMGARYAAGLPGAVFAQAVNLAAAEAKNAVDVAVLDTCFGANFEQLARFGPDVKFVVAFEDAIPNASNPTGRIPLDKMLIGAENSKDGREAAIGMAREAGKFFGPGEISDVPLARRFIGENYQKLKTGTDSTVAAIDMAALKGRLHPALDKLGHELSQACRSDTALASSLRTAKKMAEIELSGDLIDLGSFLAHTLTLCSPESPAHKALKSAQEALQKTLIAHRTGSIHKLSGLSVHTRDRRGGGGEISPDGSYPLRGDHLPQAWVKFVKETLSEH